jgi:hypothetical protein
MKRFIPFVLVILATGCGSTGTDSSGTGDDDDGTSGGFTCASFTAGPGIICDNTTSPPTIRADVGTGAGQVAAGDDPRLASIDPDKGKYLMSFVPSALEAPAGTVMAGPTGAFLIKNPATGKMGLRGADELCKLKNAAYPNAHVCTNEEIIWNVRNGGNGITAGMTGVAIGSQWDPGNGGAPRTSFKGTCGMLTYNSGDLTYTGTIWEALLSDPKQAGLAADALVVNFRGNVACNTVGTPIACCQ